MEVELIQNKHYTFPDGKLITPLLKRKEGKYTLIWTELGLMEIAMVPPNMLSQIKHLPNIASFIIHVKINARFLRFYTIFYLKYELFLTVNTR